MSPTRASFLLALAAIQGLAACAPKRPVAEPAPQPAAAGATAAARPTGAAAAPGAATAAPAPSGPKTIASVTKTSRKLDGLFSLYQDTVNGALHLAVKKDQLSKEFIYFAHAQNGVVAAGYFRGMYNPASVFSIRKSFNKIEFAAENTGFEFDRNNALHRSATANISPALLASQEIVAEDAATGTYLIKADDLFLTEALSQIKPSPNPNARPGQSFTLGNLSKAKTKYTSLNNYPANTDVTVEYVYENPAPLVQGGREVTDPRNVSIQVRHSLIEVPQNDFKPRLDDPRVGYFSDMKNNMVSTSATPYQDLIHRWYLKKKDPTAAVSEPVEPLVFWIENTTPVEIRQTVQDATLAWNEAFEAAGFRNAIVVKQQPDDADWDAGDIRYNVLRWTSSPRPPFGGYGPSFANPRTGQILGADIMLEYSYLTGSLREDRLFSTTALNLEAPESLNHSQTCAAGHYLQQTTLAGMAALRAEDADQVTVSEFMKQSIYYLILHEVGHTLGLNHNMKASQMLSPAEINNRELTQRVALMGSVMDYPTVNLASKGQAQGDFFISKPGPYDVWAIQFGYTENLEGLAREKLLARSTEPALAFGNDADDMRAPGLALDPRVMIFDMSNDVIGYSTGRFQRVNDTMGKLLQKYSTPGQSFHELRNAYLILTGEYSGAATAVSRYVGGVYVDRAMAGQPGATKPFTPVSERDQRRAMAALGTYVFAPDAFRAPGELYNHLAMQRRGFEHFGATEDPKIHSRILNIQRNILNHLLHPRTLTRMTDTRLYGNSYAPAEMMSDLTQSIFAADARGNVNTFRQNLQIEYVNRLANVIGEGKAQYDYTSQSLALQQLRDIRGMLAGKSGVNAETVAHTNHVRFAIDKALKTD